MVSDNIDIKRLTLEELSGVINMYPWYAGARKEYFDRTRQLDLTFLYIPDRKLLYNSLHADVREDYTDAAIHAAVMDATQTQKQIYVVGGDYFSQMQYDGVRENSDNIFRNIAKAGEEHHTEIPQDDGSLEEFYTETLAQTYYEQEYFDKAKEIYSKLSLRYPEKSAYFAGLIEKIEKSI